MAPTNHLWHNDVTLHFIELYAAEPCIWDPRHPDHKNRNENNEAWERIANAMSMSIECSVDDLKRKKESLMTTYRTLVRKKKKDPEYVTNWFCFEKLQSFLGEIYFGDDEELHIKEPDPDTYYPYSKRRRSSTSNRKLRSRHSTTKIKKEVLDDDTPLAYATESHSDDDECELYCQLLAKKLRRLHQHQRDIVMHEIDNIMFNAKINGNSTGNNKQRRYFSQRTQSPLNVDIVVSENNEHCEEEYLEDPIED